MVVLFTSASALTGGRSVRTGSDSSQCSERGGCCWQRASLLRATQGVYPLIKLSVPPSELLASPSELSSVTQRSLSVTHRALSVTQRALSLTQRAPSVTQRALGVTQRALSVTQRALCVTQRALSVTQRALNVTRRARSVTQRALTVTQRALSVFVTHPTPHTHHLHHTLSSNGPVAGSHDGAPRKGVQGPRVLEEPRHGGDDARGYRQRHG